MTILDSQSTRAEFLAGVSIFAGLPDALRADIAARSTWVQVPAGAWLFRQGDVGDSLYVVRSGRLEAVLEEPEQVIARVLGRGAAVGELALLMGAPRSASVRVRRDSELLKLEREQFEHLLKEEPEFALALTRELGRELQESRALITPKGPLPATIGLLEVTPGKAFSAVRQGLSAALGRWGSVVEIDQTAAGGDPSEYGSLLDEAERKHDQVLLFAGTQNEDERWTSFCLRQSDRVLAVVGDDAPPPSLEGHAELKGCDLLFVERDSRAARMARWLELLQPRATYRLRAGSEFRSSIEALARRLAGRSVGVVLSGGGARGFAHIGVLEELLAAGITIDRVGGCSMGAFVGALFAMGLEPQEIRARCREELVDRNPLGDYTLPLVSIVRGQRARAMMTRSFGSARIEELPRDYFCVSCDLLSSDLIVHRRGLLLEAVGASMCLPGVLAPLSRDGHLLVDGGVLSNLPVEPMATTGEGPVIAVDVTAQFLPPEARAPKRGRPRTRQWAIRARRSVVGAEEQLPSLKETLTRSIGIGSVDAVEVARRRADLLIAPETGAVGVLEFRALDRMIEIGRQAARAALEGAPEFLSS